MMGAPEDFKRKLNENKEDALPPCYADAILEADSFISLDVPQRKTYLAPWLTEHSIFMVSAWRGAGKSGWVLGILDAITKCKGFGPWEPRSAVNCLYLDGEMAVQDVISRLTDLGSCQRKSKLWVYCDSYAHTLGLPKANLLDSKWQEGVRDWMKDHAVKLWVIDNLASLSGGIDENSKEAWDPIGKYLVSLRFDGITTGIIHHDGKGGVQRGTSAREDHCDICISLKKPSDYRAEEGARFVVTFTKSRIPTEDLPLIADVEFRLMQTTGDVLEWTWKGAAVSLKNSILRTRRLNDGRIFSVIDGYMRWSRVRWLWQ
jgi:hypothetical protein